MALCRWAFAGVCALSVAVSCPAGATTILIELTPERILVAADTLNVLLSVNRGESRITFESQTICKLKREGDIFFAVYGIERSGDIDLVALATHAARTPGSIRQKLAVFGKLASEPKVARSLTETVAAQERAGSRVVGIIGALFISPIDHAFGVDEYLIKNGQVLHSSQEIQDLEIGGVPKYRMMLMGIHDAVRQLFAENPELKTRQGADHLVALIEAQIAREQTRKVPLVGGPITVLDIANGRASWVEGFQGPCPDWR
jgi:hypothetical protein